MAVCLSDWKCGAGKPVAGSNPVPSAFVSHSEVTALLFQRDASSPGWLPKNPTRVGTALCSRQYSSIMSVRKHPYLISATFRPDVQLDYEKYPFNIPAVRDLPNIEFHPNVTFFVGENGSGKSTILEA